MAAGLTVMQRAPTAAGQMLIAVDMWVGPMPEIVVIAGAAGESNAVLADLHSHFLPNRVIACRTGKDDYHSPHLEPLFAGKTGQPPGPTVYVCEHFACQVPVHGGEAIKSLWKRLADQQPA